MNKDCCNNRVCIAVRRVLDSCRKQIGDEESAITLSGQPTGDAPFVFVSASSTQVNAIVSDLVVARIDGKPNLARIQCVVTIPLSVTLRDANGELIRVSGNITVPEDIVMHVPCPSKFPFEIIATACANCPSGVYNVQTNTVTAVTCAEVITKVTSEVDMLVPSYGYCPTPCAVDFDAQECKRFFETPLYPQN